MNKIYFSKVKDNAKIPSKLDEDAGYDIYCCFDEDELILPQNEVTIIPTGIATAFSSDYVLFIKERSSSGALGMSLRMGVIDSGYRGELFVGINNTINKRIIITKKVDRIIVNDKEVLYPYLKAIAQGVYISLPKLITQEIPYDILKQINSKRMFNKLGESGK